MSQRIARRETEVPGSKDDQLKTRIRQDDISPSAMTLPVPDQRQMTSCSGMIMSPTNDIQHLVSLYNYRSFNLTRQISWSVKIFLTALEQFLLNSLFLAILPQFFQF